MHAYRACTAPHAVRHRMQSGTHTIRVGHCTPAGYSLYLILLLYSQRLRVSGLANLLQSATSAELQSSWSDYELGHLPVVKAQQTQGQPARLCLCKVMLYADITHHLAGRLAGRWQ